MDKIICYFFGGLIILASLCLLAQFIRVQLYKRQRRREYSETGTVELKIRELGKHGPPDYATAMRERAIQEMGLSAFTAVMRGIHEGPGTAEEKEIKRKKFLAAMEMSPEDLTAAAELRTRAKKQANVAPWDQG
jgi:hypothetical protein